MPRTPSSRLCFAVIVAVLVSIIGRNLYRRHLTTALVHAVEAKDVAQVRALLDSGVDANIKQPNSDPARPPRPLLSLVLGSYQGEAPADAARMSANEEIACLLIRHGAWVEDDPRGYHSYLQDACGCGNVPVARCLLEHGAGAEYGSMYANSPLKHAIDYAQYAGNPGKAGHASAAEQKALRLRISRDIIALLRQHGARLTPLQAVQMGDADLLREVLASGANADQQGQDGQTALYAAAAADNLPLMQALLAHGADPNLVSGSLGPPLIAAVGYGAGKGSVSVVELLLAHGAKVNVVSTNFASPLMDAIIYKHSDIARLLLAHKADPNLRPTEDVYGGDSLTAAARALPELVPDLLAHHADINVGDGAPLKAALRARNNDIARYLLAHGAKIYPATSRPLLITPGGGTNPKPHLAFVATPSTLQTAVTVSAECFEVLMQAGATLGSDKADILLAAASAGRAELFARLIALGANVNAVDAEGNTPLTEAIKYAPSGVQTLLEHGANPDIVTMGQTPLLIAAQRENTGLVRLLLAHSANPNLKPARGHTPLYYARHHRNADILRLLEQAGAKEE